MDSGIEAKSSTVRQNMVLVVLLASYKTCCIDRMRVEPLCMGQPCHRVFHIRGLWGNGEENAAKIQNIDMP